MYTRLRNCNNEVVYIILRLCNDCAPVKTLAIKKLSEIVLLKKVKASLHIMITLNAVIKLLEFYIHCSALRINYSTIDPAQDLYCMNVR